MFGIYEDHIKDDFVKILKINCEKIQKYAKVENLFEKLKEMGYLEAPASTKYHCCFEGGLMCHSLNVLKELKLQSEMHSVKWEREESPIIIALFHDLCKVDFYSKSKVKKWNTSLNKYEEVEQYVYDDKRAWLGMHAERSAIMTMDLIHLTEEEVACIMWHMGVGDSQAFANGYRNAYRGMPNILYTHVADSIATLREDLKEI